jgi:flagellar hook-associated protein 3 FlgL
MRVASKTAYDAIKYNLSNITEGMFKANETVSSGKRIIHLSDDPVSLTQALNIKSTLSNIDQLGRNITLGNSWLNASESALSSVQGILSDARALSVQMATGTVGSAERASNASTVQNMLDEIIGLANTQVNGRYIFAGAKTDTAPFSEDGTYTGDASAFSIRIGKGETLAIGHDGEAVFGNVFATLAAFKTALEDNDIDGVRAVMDDLESHFDQISGAISDVGARSSRLEIRENIFQDMKITGTDRLSKVEDADITEAVTDLSEKELAYRAALASSSKIMELSLVDYLS